MRKILVLAVVGLLILFGAFAGFSALSAHRQQSAIRKPADAFVTAVLSNDSDTSYGLYTKNTQNSLSQTAWASQVVTMSNAFKGNQATLKSISVGKTLSFVDYGIAGNDGNYILSLSLAAGQGGWLVQSFSSRLVLQ